LSASQVQDNVEPGAVCRGHRHLTVQRREVDQRERQPRASRRDAVEGVVSGRIGGRQPRRHGDAAQLDRHAREHAAGLVVHRSGHRAWLSCDGASKQHACDARREEKKANTNHENSLRGGRHASGAARCRMEAAAASPLH
jgi:hypothetical protein